MALIIADRVKETTTTQGTGTVTLGGSTFGGFQSFSDSVGEGNSTYYCIENGSQVTNVFQFRQFKFFLLLQREYIPDS